MKYIELTEDIQTCIQKDKFIDLLHTKCHSYMQSKIKLYRGIDPFNNADGYISACEYGIGKIRQDRKPKDSTKLEADIFDGLMEFKGWPFRKSNTLSVSVDLRQAEQFGIKHEIYPFENTSYLYSHKNFSDFLAIASEFRRMAYYDKHINQKLSLHEIKLLNTNDLVKEYGKIFFETCPYLEVTTNPIDLKKAIGEVLIHGNLYLVKGL